MRSNPDWFEDAMQALDGLCDDAASRYDLAGFPLPIPPFSAVEEARAALIRLRDYGDPPILPRIASTVDAGVVVSFVGEHRRSNAEFYGDGLPLMAKCHDRSAEVDRFDADVAEPHGLIHLARFACGE